ncbi:MAG: ATP-binding cassette domain-containing protein [Acidobacteriota bacterium]
MSDSAAYRITGLEHRFGQRPVLDIPDLELPHGEIGAVVGPNGAGKSTLLSIMALLLRPTRGRIVLDGVDCAGGGAARRGRLDVTLVHQRPVLFSTSVEKNIAFGMKARGVAKEEVARRTRQAAAEMRIEHLLGRDARSLSGGEAQRVVLARAFVLDTRVLLLDEPASFLEDSLLPHVEEMIVRRNAGGSRSTWIATHDAAFATRITHRIIRIEAGRIASIETR